MFIMTTKNGLWLILVFVIAGGVNCPGYAPAPSCGDGFLYLGESGCAYLEDAYVTDLDYSRGFSVEAVARIEPHQVGGRWGTFLEKGSEVVLRHMLSPGYALGISEGNSETFGKSIMAKIGDGVTHIVIESPKFYQGYVYAIMTWDVNSKRLALYVNGEPAASRTDASISPDLIENRGDLRIGKGDYGLRRNVFLARIWNRLLSSSEVMGLWTSFKETRGHTLPSGFDASDLVSQWLMDQTCSPTGGPGPDRIKDSVRTNHLKVAGKARLVQASGPLTVVYPANGAKAVDKSVTLKVSGGASALGASLVHPLHYLFQIDEGSGFDSAALRQSGWIAHYGQWKPVLKPDTKYYWRVKVRDSGSHPYEPSFSQAYSFRTKGRSIWYVRPLVDLDEATDELGNPVIDPGVYGTQDGTSYANAFNGIAGVKWGEGGVEAGDTLYVCDTHVYHARDNYWAPPVTGYVKESGFSSEYPITIAMNSPSGPGRLTGVFQDTETAVEWTGPDENGVYRTDDLPYGAAVQLIADRYVWLDRQEATTWKGHAGAVCNRPRQGEPWLIGMSYVKTVDGRPPGTTIYSPGLGFRFDLGRSSFVRFYRCDFFNSLVVADSNRHTISEMPPSAHVSFESCDIGYADGTLMDLSEGMDNWTVADCDVHDGGKGIHTGSPGHVYNLLVERCQIHDIGGPNFPDDDAHAIGIQNGANHILQSNHIWNIAGSAIEFWSSSYSMQNMTVRYNFIHDTTGLAQTSASGVVISGGERSLPGQRTGFRIHHNIVMNTAGGDESWRGFGISSNSMDSVEIYNNLLYNTYHGIRLVTTTPEPGYPVSAKVYNNMIVYPQGRYAFVFGNSQPWTGLFWDYNLYYPASDIETDFAFGQSVPRDNHSVLGDPRFVVPRPENPEDFRLQADSPAIDGGVDVGLTGDFEGNPIPQGRAPDIGVFEDQAQ